jgi:uncharacterized protein YodC (DUF2158 family)
MNKVHEDIPIWARHPVVEKFVNFLQGLTSNEAEYKALLSYMAACVQYPDRGFSWALVLSGPQGSGKGMLARVLTRAIGYGTGFGGFRARSNVNGRLTVIDEPDLYRLYGPLWSAEFFDTLSAHISGPNLAKYFVTISSRFKHIDYGRRYFVIIVRKSFPLDVATDFGQVMSRRGAMDAVVGFLRAYPIPDRYNPTMLSMPPKLRYDNRGREVCDEAPSSSDNGGMVAHTLKMPVPHIMVGSVVRLKSGGPAMTVISYQNGKVGCIWFGNGRYNGGSGEYPPECLESVPVPVATNSTSPTPDGDFIDLSGPAGGPKRLG